MKVQPAEVLANDTLLLIDVRPPTERYGSVGFIPTSLGLPRDDDPDRYVEALERCCGEHEPVFVCMSGARAERCLADLGSRLEFPRAYLAGGVLGWGALGLPLCGRDQSPSTEPIDSPTEFPRHLAACFVGELAETSLDRGLDPLKLLRECFDRAGQDFDAPVMGRLHAVLDYAAIASRRLGTPLERIAANIDRMLSVLPRATASAIGVG